MLNPPITCDLISFFRDYLALKLCLDATWAEPPAGGDSQVQFGDGQVPRHAVQLGVHGRFARHYEMREICRRRHLKEVQSTQPGQTALLSDMFAKGAGCILSPYKLGNYGKVCRLLNGLRNAVCQYS